MLTSSPSRVKSQQIKLPARICCLRLRYILKPEAKLRPKGKRQPSGMRETPVAQRSSNSNSYIYLPCSSNILSNFSGNFVVCEGLNTLRFSEVWWCWPASATAAAQAVAAKTETIQQQWDWHITAALTRTAITAAIMPSSAAAGAAATALRVATAADTPSPAIESVNTKRGSTNRCRNRSCFSFLIGYSWCITPALLAANFRSSLPLGSRIP